MVDPLEEAAAPATAAYLARAGKKVLLLERRAVPGGQLVSETVAKDFTINTPAPVPPDSTVALPPDNGAGWSGTR